MSTYMNRANKYIRQAIYHEPWLGMWILLSIHVQTNNIYNLNEFSILMIHQLPTSTYNV